MEVPEAALARFTPDDYELKSQKKGFRRSDIIISVRVIRRRTMYCVCDWLENGAYPCFCEYDIMTSSRGIPQVLDEGDRGVA